MRSFNNPIHVRPARGEDSLAIARLWVEFGDFRRAFGAQLEAGACALALDFVQMGMGGLFVAESAGEVLGALQLIDDVENYRELERRSSVRPFLRNLGYFRGAWALTCLVLGTRVAKRATPANACYANFIAVKASSRGFPVAVSLMLHARRYAKQADKTYLAGWINTANRRAIEFFASFFRDFQIVKVRHSFLSRWLLGVPGWVFVLMNVEATTGQSRDRVHRLLSTVKVCS